MLRNKLSVLTFVLLSIVVTINSAPFKIDLTPYQKTKLQERTAELVTLKFKNRDRSTISPQEAMRAVTKAFENEIKRLEDVTHVRLNSMELNTINSAVTDQMHGAGVYDSAIIESAQKEVQMLAIKFHDRGDSNPMTQDEAFEETLFALDNEIRHLKNGASLLSPNYAVYYLMFVVTAGRLLIGA